MTSPHELSAGMVGAGRVPPTIARRALAAARGVVLSNSRGPTSLADAGGRPGRNGRIVVDTTNQWRHRGAQAFTGGSGLIGPAHPRPEATAS